VADPGNGGSHHVLFSLFCNGHAGKQIAIQNDSTGQKLLIKRETGKIIK
jgi:hypothetical protein